MQEAPPWKAALCMAWSSTALGVPRSERERLDCQDPGVNLPPILSAKEFGSDLEIVRPRLCSGDADLCLVTIQNAPGAVHTQEFADIRT